LDLYCPLLEVQRCVAELRNSADELGLKLEQGNGEFV
jgi:hypothetical protein